MNQKEDISIRYYLTDKVHAPVRENTRLGIMKCYLGDEVIREFPLGRNENHCETYFENLF